MKTFDSARTRELLPFDRLIEALRSMFDHANRTAFKSVGTALEDLAAAILVYEADDAQASPHA